MAITRYSDQQGSKSRQTVMRVCMYVCTLIKLHITAQSGPVILVILCKSMDQPGNVANPARGQLNREINISLSTFARENLVSRDGFGSPVPRQPASQEMQPSGCLRESACRLRRGGGMVG